MPPEYPTSPPATSHYQSAPRTSTKRPTNPGPVGRGIKKDTCSAHQMADVDSIYASDDASDVSAVPPLQATAMSDPLLSSALSDDHSGLRLDDSRLESLSRASSLLGDILTEELDFNPDGIFDTLGPTPPNTDDEDTMEDLPQLNQDPLFQGSDALFERILDSGSDDLAPDASIPPAFDEDPVIRNAYITAYLLSACHGYTQEGIKAYLDSMHESFTALQRKGKYEEFQHWRLPGLDDVGEVPPLNEPRDPLDAFNNVNWVMGDITNGWGWRAVSWGWERRKVSSAVSLWGVEDVLVEEKQQRFVSLPCGLLFSINIDWFSPTKRSRAYSTGAIYVTILNNPRSKHFLPQETILYCVIPGPQEPTLEQLNHITEPLVEELWALYEGVTMRIHGEPDNQQFPVNSMLYINTSDIPASRKITGLQAFSMRDKRRFRKYAYRWRDASTEERERIEIECGILVVGRMLTRWSRMNNPYEKLETFLGSIWWPSTIGRVPAKISGTLKADQWWNFATVLPVALYYAWQQNGKIPDCDLPRPAPKSKAGAAFAKTEKLLREHHKAYHMHVARQLGRTIVAAHFEEDDISMDRNYQCHFKAVLDACSAIRIWTAQSITPNKARRPVHGFWLFGPEPNNGHLVKVNTNGHTGGELEGTMMQSWIKNILIHDLVRMIEELDEQNKEDLVAIRKLKNYLKGWQGSNGSDEVELPPRGKRINLNMIQINGTSLYGLIFNYLQILWNSQQAGKPFVATAVQSFSHAHVNGIQFGACTSYRGKGISFAYMDGRIAVQIQHILSVKHECRDPRLAALLTAFAIVKCL
ncbi:hypothetical protein HETIRDRAFT_426132 [Heterobasidion irregulare TC 32-1]|uniref:Uncharacterized protein n=1 Tax=Heterobasidion irregulare (strain TC 32-1) TaxID=747525 RepID=W4K9N1_HETIT|nr:uncharacterized protein HETIRDRAFT_426132 [Heterobasidion irregulare TC 32-1]ETW82454.1 hypothetical protein HETIRDRAFT_426132 [Heterobasidion irregulare TC 32-1]